MTPNTQKTNIVKVLLCDLINNRLTPPGGHLKTTFCYKSAYARHLAAKINVGFKPAQDLSKINKM